MVNPPSKIYRFCWFTNLVPNNDLSTLRHTFLKPCVSIVICEDFVTVC